MNKRKIWQIPLLREEGDKGLHRSVTWLELFFDLFFVAVIGSLTHDLSENISILGIKKFVIGFIPIWWVWIGATIYNERFETEGIENRIFTFLLMIPVAGLAVFSRNAIGEHLKFFLFSYMIARIIIIFLWARAGFHNKAFRPTSNTYIVGFSISVILVLTGALLDSSVSLVLFPIALIIDLSTPYFTIKHQKKLPRYTTSKLPERIGLFTIIVLGEMVIGLIGGLSHHEHFSFSMIPLGIMGIATALGFWWLYFDFIARRHFHPKVGITILWVNTHMPLVMTFVLVGASLYNLAAHASHPSEIALVFHLVIIGIALVLIGLLELTLERKDKEPTHPIFSPGLKFLIGIVGICLGVFKIFHSVEIVMLFGIILIIINIIYGAYIWFSQEIEDE